MTYFRRTGKIGLYAAAFIIMALAFVGGAANAGGGAVPVPHPAKAAKGENCVAPIPEMRRYHMKYLKHQRDETLRKGIRGNPYSLKECIACHAVEDKTTAGARTVKPFCSSCHEYVAVKIDCFSCHTGKADDNPKISQEILSLKQLAAHMKNMPKDESFLK